MIKKLISTALVLCLLTDFPCQHSAFAQEPGHAFLPSITLPPGLGRIQEFHQGKTAKTVYFIQDAHDSLEAQENIARLIHYLVRAQKVTTVFEEGYEGPVPTDAVFDGLDEPAKKKIGAFLLDRLKLGGAEYAHLTRKQPKLDFRLIGADSDNLQRQNITAWKKTAAVRALAENEIREIEGPLAALMEKYFQKNVRAWIDLQIRRETGTLNILDYLTRLETLLPNSNDVILNVVKDLKTEILRFAQNDKEKKPQNALTPEKLLRQIAVLDRQIEEKFFTQTWQRELFEGWRALQLFKKFSQLELSFAEYEKLRPLLLNQSRPLTEKMARLTAERSGKTAAFSKIWERALREAALYYETAQKRDAVVRKNLRHWEQSRETSAILVFGGFHAPDLEKTLAELGFSYAMIIPRIQALSPRHQQIYRALMSGESKKQPPVSKSQGRSTRALEFYQDYGGPRRFDLAAARLEVDAIAQQIGVSNAESQLSRRSELRAATGDWENEKRLLVVTENADKLEQFFQERSAQSGKLVVRLNVKEDADLQRLKTRLHVAPDGTEVRKPGDLPSVIQQGGVLILDAHGADPRQVEAFNSLFDAAAFWNGTKASPDLQVIVTVPETQLASYANTLYSRSRMLSEQSLGLAPYRDPLQMIERRNLNDKAPLPADGILLDLRESPRWRELLTGKLTSSLETGKTVFIGNGSAARGQVYGLLEQAVREDRPLIISGGRWNDPEFSSFIRKILLSRRVTINGEDLAVPARGFRILAQPWDPHQGVEAKKIVRLLPSDAVKIASSQKMLLAMTNEGLAPLWVINSETQPLLFSRVSVSPQGYLSEGPGLLDGTQPVRLRITEELDPGIWHALMRSPSVREVELAEGVGVPEAYQDSVVERAPAPPAPKTSTSKIQRFAAKDLPFAREKIREKFSGHKVLFRPVTPSTSASELNDSIELVGVNAAGIRIHQNLKQAVLQALEDGQVVVLEGLFSSPLLKKQLAGLFTENPYLVVNGEQVLLASLPGQLVFLDFEKPGAKILDQEAEPLDPGFLKAQEEYKKILLRDPAIADGFQEYHYNALWKAFERFRSIPNPRSRGLARAAAYPEQFQPTLAHLRLLFRLYHELGDWLEAFEYGIIRAYRSDPEVAAYMRVQAKLAFYKDEPGRPKGENISRTRLNALLNSLPDDQDWENHLWQAYDLFDLRTLMGLEEKLGVAFGNADDSKIHGAERLQEALIKDAADNPQSGMRPDLEGYYRRRFELEDHDTSRAPKLIEEWRREPSDPQARLEKLTKIVRASRLVMLKGAPGTGKSFILKSLAKSLGYENDPAAKREEVFGPFTTGADVTPEEMLGHKVEKDGRTVETLGPAGRWAKSEKGILLWDEANLADPHFHDFLSDSTGEDFALWMFGQKYPLKEHGVVMTGNDEKKTEDRRATERIEQEGITLYFDDFEEAFLELELRKYLAGLRDADDLAKLLLDLHRIFRQMNPQLEFSIRELQEAANRVRVFAPNLEDPAQVIFQSWLVYRDRFSPEEREALALILTQKYKAGISELEAARIKEYQRKHSEWAARHGLDLDDETARFAAGLEERLALRAAWMRGELKTKPKTSDIILGPSGWGKDYVLEKILQAAGLVDGLLAQNESRPGTEKYYLINASLDDRELEEKVARARQEGAVVVLREMNFLRTGVLEGKLNDVLTEEDATPGFSFMGTLNGTGFSGRNRLSSPLLSRSQVSAVHTHSREGYRGIAQVYLSATGRSVPADALERLISLHLEISSKVEDPQYQPTTREISRALDLLAEGRPWEEAIQSVYGPVFFDWLFKGTDLQSLPDAAGSPQALSESGGPQTGRVLQKIAEFLLPAFRGKLKIAFNSVNGLSYYDEGRHLFVISTQAGQESLKVLLALISAQLFLSGFPFSNEAFEQSLERQLSQWSADQVDEDKLFTLAGDHAGSAMALFSDFLRFWALNNLSSELYLPGFQAEPTRQERDLAALMRSKNVRGMGHLLAEADWNARDFFRKVLMAYAHGELKRQDIEAFSVAAGEDFWGLFFADNPSEAILQALPWVERIKNEKLSSREPEEIRYHQSRVAQWLEKIQEPMETLALPVRDRPQSEEAQMNELIKALFGGGAESGPPGPDFQEALRATRKAIDLQKSAGLEAEIQKMKKDLAKIRRGVKRGLSVYYENYRRRVEEIRDQLNPSKKHSRSVGLEFLKFRARAAKNPDLSAKAQEISARLKIILKNSKILREFFEKIKASMVEAPPGTEFERDEKLEVRPLYGLSFEDEQKRKFGEAQIAQRPPVAALHVIGRADMNEMDEALEPEVQEKPDPLWQKIRSRFRAVLETQAAAFYKAFAESGEVSAVAGTLDFEAYLRTLSLEESRKGRGAIFSRAPHTLVLAGGGVLTPFQEEIFAFLFSQGFEAAVLVSETEVISHLNRVDMLSAALKKSRRNAEELPEFTLLETQLAKKGLRDPKVLTLSEIQERLEKGYLYGAVSLALEGELGELNEPASGPAAAPALIAGEVPEEQLQKLVRWMANLGIDLERLHMLTLGEWLANLGASVDHFAPGQLAEQQIHLDLSLIPVTDADLQELSRLGLVNLVELNLMQKTGAK